MEIYQKLLELVYTTISIQKKIISGMKENI